jgi:hypothetical protein
MPVSDVLLAVDDHTTRAATYALYRDYEAGKHSYPYASPAFERKFRWVLKQARANKCPTVISNFTDRVTLASWSGAGAQRAGELAEQLGLGRVLNLAVKEAWQEGDAYVLGWPGRNGQVKPWYHRADQAGFMPAEDDPDEAEWVYKLWVDRAGFGRVNIYYPDRVERSVTRQVIQHQGVTSVMWPTDEGGYKPYDGDRDGDTITYTSVGLPTGQAPWVHLPLDPNTQGGHGTSILRDVIPLQDGLNHTLAAMILGVEQYGAPLRALMNYQPNTYIDSATGKPTEEALRFDETRNRIFGVKGEGPLVQLDPPDSSNLIRVLEWFSREIANEVGVPVSDIAPDLGNVPSGTALRVLAARRTAAVVDFTDTITPKVSTLMGLLGVPDAWPTWADPAPTDEAERLESAEARANLGYPLSENLRELGKDTDDIDRILAAAAAEQANIGQFAVEAFRAGQDPARVVRG